MTTKTLCFSCDKQLGKYPALVTCHDEQDVFVGSKCYRLIKSAGIQGYQPPLGGPKLYLKEFDPKTNMKITKYEKKALHVDQPIWSCSACITQAEIERMPWQGNYMDVLMLKETEFRKRHDKALKIQKQRMNNKQEQRT